MKSFKGLLMLAVYLLPLQTMAVDDDNRELAREAILANEKLGLQPTYP